MKVDIFKNKKANHKKLIDYGFKFEDGVYKFRADILDNQFEVLIEISQGKIKTKTIEKSTGFEFILHLTDAIGGFVGQVRQEHDALLQDIAEKCFDANIFKSKQSIQIIEYVAKKYGDNPEFLWESTPQNAVFRRKDNKKWYIALLTIQKNRLNIGGEELVEIINLQASPEVINQIVDDKIFFRGWHMNKQHWFTICLDDSVSTEDIFQFIDTSYLLAHKKNKSK